MANGEVIIKMTDVIGRSLCMSSDDGEKVYKEIVKTLHDGQKVALSFEGAEVISAFLNVAVGQLYNGQFAEDFISSNIRPINAPPDDLHLLKRVVERAKVFYKDPERIKNANKEILGDER
ncbi:MAG: STAS-like domain-containing protein [bacterium]